MWDINSREINSMEEISSFHAILDIKRKNFLMETLKERVYSHGWLFTQKEKINLLWDKIELKLNIFF